MQKAITGLVVVLCLAGVASAVATGPGGTFYFATADTTNGQVMYEYLNVTSDWQKCDSNGNIITTNAVTRYASVQGGLSGTGGTQTISSFGTWINPSDSNKFTENAYAGAANGGADLYQALYYNTTAAGNTGGTGTAVMRGLDFVKVKKAGGLNNVDILNDGFNASSSQSSGGTVELHYITACDSNFLTATQGQAGILFEGHYERNIWVDSSGANTNLTTPVNVGINGGANNDPNGVVRYCALSQATVGTVWNASSGFVTATGATAHGQTSSSVPQNAMYIAYRTPSTASGYTAVLTYNSDMAANMTQYNPIATGSPKTLCIGDTNGDGRIDVYYNYDYRPTSGTFIGIAHGQDLNGDGDFGDGPNGVGNGFNGTPNFASANEVTRFIAGSSSLSSQYFANLIQVSKPGTLGNVYANNVLINGIDPNTHATVGLGQQVYAGGQWVFVQYLYLDNASQTTSIRLIGMDPNGNNDGTSLTIDSATWSAASVLSGDPTMLLTNTLAQTCTATLEANFAFAPLVQSQMAPEPATLMLLGTGVLGLAGIIRRRMIS